MRIVLICLFFNFSCLFERCLKENIYLKTKEERENFLIRRNFEIKVEDWASKGNLEDIKALWEAKGEKLGKSSLLTSLDDAAKAGHLEVVRFLVEKGVSGHYEAIKFAAQQGHIGVVEFLLDKNPTEEYFIRVINFGNDSRNIEIVEMAMEKWLSSPLSQPKSQKVLVHAARVGSQTIVKKMIDKGADNLDEAMRYASREGHIEVVRMLIDEGVTNYNGSMLAASEKGHIDIVNLMLEKGANDFNTTMVYAARGGYTEIVKSMIGKGANGKFNLGMYWAAISGQSGYERVVELMMEKGADSHKEILKLLDDTKFDKVRDSILKVFIYEVNPRYIPKEYKEKLKSLEDKLKRNCLLDFEDTLLDIGAKNYAFSFFYLPPEIVIEVFKYLNIKNRIELLFLYSNRDLKEDDIEVIRRDEWDDSIPINAKDSNGITMLHKLCYYGHRNKVNFLVEKGVLKNMEDKEGKTPLWYAKQGGSDGRYEKDKGFLKWIRGLEDVGFQ